MSVATPEGWALTHLRDVIHLRTGPFGSALHQSDYISGGTPLVNPMHIVGGRVTPSADMTVSSQMAAKLSEYRLQPGDVVLGRRGEMGRCAVISERERGWICGTGSLIVRPLQRALHPDYLQLLLTSRRVVDYLLTASVGSTMANLNQQHLLDMEVSLPPAAEQTRIVLKLDELLSDLDAGVAELKAAQKKLQRYRQSLLKAAVEGALTAEWRQKNPPTETGAELLQRILRKRRARWEEQQLAKFAAQGKAPPKGWKDNFIEPDVPATASLPTLPVGWAWASIEQLGEVTTGFTPPTSDQANFGGPIPFLKPTDLDAGYHVTRGRESLTEAGAQTGRVLPAKTVLVTCIGATIGKVGFARAPCATNQQINAVSPEPDGVLAEFVYWVLCSGFGQEQIIANASATTLPILNKSKFSKLPMMVPPAEEQREIVQRLETHFATASGLQAAHETAMRQSTAQRQNLLRAAFRGELVAQDPNDEPASALLERLRAERSGTKPAKTERKTRKTKGAA